jgi:hypothetical protein
MPLPIPNGANFPANLRDLIDQYNNEFNNFNVVINDVSLEVDDKMNYINNLAGLLSEIRNFSQNTAQAMQWIQQLNIVQAYNQDCNNIRYAVNQFNRTLNVILQNLIVPPANNVQHQIQALQEVANNAANPDGFPPKKDFIDYAIGAGKLGLFAGGAALTFSGVNAIRNAGKVGAQASAAAMKKGLEHVGEVAGKEIATEVTKRVAEKTIGTVTEKVLDKVIEEAAEQIIEKGASAAFNASAKEVGKGIAKITVGAAAAGASTVAIQEIRAMRR